MYGKLILVRHGQSVYNEQNRFTGWKDVDLTQKGIDEATSAVVEELKKLSTEITDDAQIKEVATISGNNDPEIGNLIATALDKVGRDGVVAIEESKTGDTSLEIVEGMQFERGYKSPYFVTDNNTMSAVLNDPYILIYDGRITQASELLNVLNKVSGDYQYRWGDIETIGLFAYTHFSKPIYDHNLKQKGLYTNKIESHYSTMFPSTYLKFNLHNSKVLSFYHWIKHILRRMKLIR